MSENNETNENKTQTSIKVIIIYLLIRNLSKLKTHFNDRNISKI